MNKLKFLIFISVIVFFVAVIAPLRLESVFVIYLPNDIFYHEWDEVRADYEAEGLEVSKPFLRVVPGNDMTMHGERAVLDGKIVHEKWVPYKPRRYHYVRISTIATGYGEVAFNINDYTKDYPVGHWTSEPIKKAVDEIFQYERKEGNNVDVANIQPTTVNVSAKGKAYARSVRVTTYGSKSEAKGAQASTSGVGVTFVTGTSSLWKWSHGITRPIPVEGYLHYNTNYSITVNDYKVGYSENNTGFPTYGTYEAEYVEIIPIIKEVWWMIKKPSGKWKTVKVDKVKGGKSQVLVTR